MRPGEALRLALRDFYENSWRLMLVNSALGAVLVVCVLAALATPAAIVLLVAVGPVVAALVHCCVTLARTGYLALTDALEGLRLHWRRGLVLGALAFAIAGVGFVAVRTYGSSPLWPLALVTLYALLVLVVYALVLWTLAIARAERALRVTAHEAAALVASRPGATLVLGFALLLVNVAGIAAAVMPFLTLTVSYTFLATAHFVLPPSTLQEAV